MPQAADLEVVSGVGV